MIKKLMRKRDRALSPSKKVGLGTDRPPSGFGYVIIPSDVDRAKYISNVYRTGTCMIATSFNDVYKDVRVPKHLIQDLKFPKASGKYGSLVGWVNTPHINQVTLFGIMVAPNEMHVHDEDTAVRSKSNGSSAFGESISLDEEGVQYALSIMDIKSTEGSIDIKANGADGDISALELYLNGEGKLYGDNLSELASYNHVKLTVGTESDSNLSTLSIKNTGVFEYNDHHGNYIKIEEGKVSIESNNGEILLGGSASEQAVLGNKLIDWLDSVIDAINAITVPTALGPSGVPINAPQFAALKAQLKTLLSTKNKVE